MDTLAETTDLLKIRAFLAEHRCAVPPWEKPTRVVEQLYAALREKRSDREFWSGLKDLLAHLEDRRFHPPAVSGSRALSGTTLATLIDDLQQVLNNGSGTGDIRLWLKRGISAAALLAFLLLGSAVAQAGETASADRAFFPQDGFSAKAIIDEQITDELLDVIEAAEMPAWVKMELLECLPELDGAYRATLLDLFAEGNEAELAAFLEAVYQPEDDLFSRTAKNGDDAGNDDQTKTDDDDVQNAELANIMDNSADGDGNACGCGDDDSDDDDHSGDDDDDDNDDNNNNDTSPIADDDDDDDYSAH